MAARHGESVQGDDLVDSGKRLLLIHEIAVGLPANQI